MTSDILFPLLSNIPFDSMHLSEMMPIFPAFSPFRASHVDNGAKLDMLTRFAIVAFI